MESSIDQRIVWDEVLNWDGEIRVVGDEEGTISPQVLTQFQKNGELLLTVGEPLGDHLQVANSTGGKLVFGNRVYEGHIPFSRDKDSITLPKTPLQNNNDEVHIQGEIQLPELVLKKDTPIAVRVIPSANLADLPPIADLSFEAHGRAILSTYDDISLRAKWRSDNEKIRLALKQPRQRPVFLRVQKEPTDRMSLTWKSRENGDALGAEPDTLSIHCKDTQFFESQ